jgi:hypothetical protein
MIQNLLIDRLQMKVRHETREEPGYELSVANGGLKMKEAAVSADGESSIRPEPGPGGLARVTGRSVPSSRIATFLMQQLLHWDHVDDRTGLTSNYDFKLEFVPEGANELPGPDLITALRQQLGLQLTPKKGFDRCGRDRFRERTSGRKLAVARPSRESVIASHGHAKMIASVGRRHRDAIYHQDRNRAFPVSQTRCSLAPLCSTIFMVPPLRAIMTRP